MHFLHAVPLSSRTCEPYVAHKMIFLQKEITSLAKVPMTLEWVLVEIVASAAKNCIQCLFAS